MQTKQKNLELTVAPDSMMSGKTFAQETLRAWLHHHQLSARSSLHKLLESPWQSVMTCCVIGIALALPAGLFLVIDNVRLLGERWDGNPHITIFLHRNLAPASVTELGEKLQAISDIDGVQYLAPDVALEDFKKRSGFAETLKLLDENPLPPAYTARPVSNNPAELKFLIHRLQRFPQVDRVRLDLEWVEKLKAILAIAERFVTLLAVLFCAGILLIIGNTIRLSVENRRDEVIVVKLVGGTDAFVRRPLLYTGFWYGFIGGCLAWGLLLSGVAALAEPALQLAVLYGSDFRIHDPGWLHGITIVLLGATLGLGGAWLAVARHIQLLEPR